MAGLLILARPHVSLLDGPRLAWWLSHGGMHTRNVLFPVDPDYAKHPVWSRLLRSYGRFVGGHRMVPMDTDKPFSLRLLAKELRRGNAVALFPQGTGIKDGPDRPDKLGALWLIKECRPQVVEVWVRSWPKNIRLMRWVSTGIPIDNRSIPHASYLQSRL